MVARDASKSTSAIGIDFLWEIFGAVSTLESFVDEHCGRMDRGGQGYEPIEG